MQVRKAALAAVLILGLVFVLPGFARGAAEEVEPDTYVITTAVHPLEFYREGPEAMMEYVERESGGRITFETFQFPELGADYEITEMISVGEILMGTAIADAGLGQMVPSVQALSMPFLFSSLDVFIELMDGPFFDELAEVVHRESNGTLRLLSAMKSSRRHLYSTKGPIRTPGDLVEHGIVMRVMPSPFHVALWEGLGTSAVTLPAAERYTALQTGMIDATEGGLMSAWQAGLMEVQQYATLTNHSFGTGYIYINEEFFQSLPSDLQQILVDGAWVAAEYDNTTIPQHSIEAERLMEEAGVIVTTLTDEEFDRWREIAQPIGVQFLSEESGIDPAWLRRVVDAVAEAEARLR